MDNIRYIRPSRGVDVSIDPGNKEFPARKSDLSVEIRHAIESCQRVFNVDASQVTKIAAETLGDDDTASPKGPVALRDKGEVFEVELDESFYRYTSDGSSRPGEPIIMPLHATSVFFCARHDRSDAWFCTTIITCEDEKLMTGEPEVPFFVWIEHPAV